MSEWMSLFVSPAVAEQATTQFSRTKTHNIVGMLLPPVSTKLAALPHCHSPVQAQGHGPGLRPLPVHGLTPAHGTVPTLGSDFDLHVSALTLRYSRLQVVLWLVVAIMWAELSSDDFCFDCDWSSYSFLFSFTCLEKLAVAFCVIHIKKKIIIQLCLRFWTKLRR